MDHAKLLDFLTSLSVSQSKLPRAVCFATSRPANHAICSFIDSSGNASGPIRRCLFIDYIIITFILYLAVKINAYQKQIKVISITSEIIYQSLVIDISIYFHCSVLFLITSDFSIHLMQLTSKLQTPITFFFVKKTSSVGSHFLS